MTTTDRDGLRIGSFAEGQLTAPRADHVGTFADGQVTGMRRERVGTFADGLETRPHHAHVGTFAAGMHDAGRAGAAAPARFVRLGPAPSRVPAADRPQQRSTAARTQGES
jgi:hypothetical protein